MVHARTAPVSEGDLKQNVKLGGGRDSKNNFKIKSFLFYLLIPRPKLDFDFARLLAAN